MASKVKPAEFPDPRPDASFQSPKRTVLAGGCFWCTEAVFRLLKGVQSVQSGYAGGAPETANYHAVCSGETGHAEVVELRFDPREIAYGQILKVFFAVAHDPTQLDRQGADVGSQYRSAIFYQSEAERRFAEAYIQQLNEAEVFDVPIVTRLEPLRAFYPAEPYHHQYAERNPTQPYICAVSDPKVAKLKSAFPELLSR